MDQTFGNHACTQCKYVVYFNYCGVLTYQYTILARTHAVDLKYLLRICLMSFSVCSTRGVTFKVVVCFNAYNDRNTHGKASRFCIGLYSQPGNLELGQHSCSYNINAFLVHFTGYKHYQCMHACISVHACMHCDTCMWY